MTTWRKALWEISKTYNTADRTKDQCNILLLVVWSPDFDTGKRERTNNFPLQGFTADLDKAAFCNYKEKIDKKFRFRFR